MKPIAFMLAAAAAACAPAAPNETASAPERIEPTEAAPANHGAPAADVPIAGVGDAPPDAAGDDADQCGASRYQWLVGRPRSEIPAKPSDANWRVTCTSCPVTMDYSSARLNIFYDPETEQVEQVRCG